MQYKISNIIKELNKLQSAGKSFITGQELLLTFTPKINNIDDYIRMFEQLTETEYYKKYGELLGYSYTNLVKHLNNQI